MANEMLLFTLVSVRPYLYEVPHVLALDEGAEFKFRFREHWIAPESRARLHELASRSSSEVSCLILYRDQASGSILPIRHASLLEVTVIGSIFHFRVAMRSIPLVEKDPDLLGRQLKELKQRHHQALGFNPKVGVELEKLVFFTDAALCEVFHADSAPKQRSENVSFFMWDQLFRLFTMLPEFQDVDFYKIVGVFDARRKKVAVRRDDGVSSYRLTAGRVYRIRLYQQRPQGPTQPANEDPGVYTVSLAADRDLVQVLRGSSRVVGKYDMLEFSLRPRDASIGLTTELSLEVEAHDRLPLDSLREFSFPISCSSGRLDIAAGSLFAIVLISLFFGDSLATATGLQQGTVRNVQVFTLFLLSVLTPRGQWIGKSVMSKLFSAG